jgi:ATP-dependent protease ClpP protease subunit
MHVRKKRHKKPTCSRAISAKAGKRGKRSLTPNTMVMSHQWSGLRWGKEHELLASQRGDDILTNMIFRHYKRHTGLRDQQIRKYLLPRSDVWLTANEVKAF